MERALRTLCWTFFLLTLLGLGLIVLEQPRGFAEVAHLIADIAPNTWLISVGYCLLGALLIELLKVRRS